MSDSEVMEAPAAPDDGNDEKHAFPAALRKQIGRARARLRRFIDATGADG